jgi:threonylcarbamoyladenosine tRNA methylthiotransferase MtaB
MDIVDRPGSFSIVTLGCKVNQYESQQIRQGLLNGGLVEVNSNADVCVVNTCTVTQVSDRKSRLLVKNIVKENPNARVLVTGCYVQLDGERAKEIPGVWHIVDNSHKYRIPEIIIGEGSAGKSCETAGSGYFGGRDRAYIKVQDGCDNYCAYCKIPLVRGPGKSRPVSEILAEASRLANSGCNEIVLTGICLGAYGKDLENGKGLLDVIRAIEAVEKIGRIRLSSIEPIFVTNELIEEIRSSGKLCRHLHIPLQSGDDTVLHLMNRHYTAGEYMRIVERIRKAVPDAGITTDVMVGFPGESDEYFENTYRLAEQIGFLRMHVFPYSKRPGTSAVRLDGQISPQVKRLRADKMRSLAERLSARFRSMFVGRKQNVLVESKPDPKTGCLVGYSDNYIRVWLESGDKKMVNGIVPVTISRIEGEHTYGIVANQ